MADYALSHEAEYGQGRECSSAMRMYRRDSTNDARRELKTAPRSESDINYLLRELDNLAEVGLGQFCQPLLEPQLATYTRMIQHP